MIFPLSTLSALPKYTAGQLYHYPAFAAASQGDKFEADLAHAMRREGARLAATGVALVVPSV